MHMADALISPAVGGAMLVFTAGAAAYSIKKINYGADERKIPLMGVMGAFTFAAQMINFSIPGTGSSGHLAGGMLLAVLLGPYAGFLTMASVLLIQALFFGDGGLLAYGCNVINLGFYACFAAYPIYKYITRKKTTPGRILAGSLVSAVAGIQIGSFSVVLETLFSGKTELPFSAFVTLMQPIHLVIGLVEGLVTSAVIIFVWRARPEILEKQTVAESQKKTSLKKVLAGFAIAALIIGGAISWFASPKSDALEWSILKTAGKAELEDSGQVYKALSQIQGKMAFLPDYGFKENVKDAETAKEEAVTRPITVGRSVSGIIGGALTLVLTVLTGLVISLIKRRGKRAAA